jgi:hypothetical protein
MGKIYASARKVHVWLGPAADEDALAVDDIFEPGEPDYEKRSFLQWRHCRAFPDNLTPEFLSLEHFVSRSWFTRRWVLQEVFLGRDVSIHCGDCKMQWRPFIKSVYALLRAYTDPDINHVLHGRVAALHKHLRSISQMDSFASKGRTSGHWDAVEDSWKYLLDLLSAYSNTVCLDERDRLYSLYGLFEFGGLVAGPVDYCSVDYRIHFSHVYTMFASGAVEAGVSQDMIMHTIQFGSLADQNESWPSWVPGWNLPNKMQHITDWFADHRLSQHQQDHWPWSLLGSSRRHSWTELSPWGLFDKRLIYAHEMRALPLRGCIHRICHVQSGTVHSDAISYLEALARTQHAMSSLTIEWVVALAMTCVPKLLSRPPFDLRNFCDGKFVDESVEDILFCHAQRFMGLLSDGASEEQPDNISEVHVDWLEFASEAKRILEGLESFCYEVEGSFTFGIAFAQVKPGDFVFRMPGAVNGKDEETGEISPSAFGLIIRPYHSQSDAGPATFRLVGMCVDWYPDVEDPEFVEVVLV